MVNDFILSTYLELGAAACLQGNSALAEHLFKAALDESQRLGESDTRHASILVRVASAYTIQKMYRKAETYYKRALGTYYNVLGPYNQQVSYVLDCLAELSCQQGKYGQAEQLYVRAQRADERANNTNPKALTERLRRLAYVYLKRSKYHEAAEAMKASQYLSCSYDQDHRQLSPNQ